jgi:hypothetical protein
LEDAAMTCERAPRIQGQETNALILHAQIEVERRHYTRAVTLLEATKAFKHQVHVQRYQKPVRRMVDEGGCRKRIFFVINLFCSLTFQA